MTDRGTLYRIICFVKNFGFIRPGFIFIHVFSLEVKIFLAKQSRDGYTFFRFFNEGGFGLIS